MHGPEHHVLVPAVLITSYYKAIGKEELIKRKLKVAKDRSLKILGGFCGTHGSCGAALGTGIFMSVITESTPLSGKEWQLSNLITSNSLQKVAMSGGPRCCKRDTYISLLEALNFLENHLNVIIEHNNSIICRFFQNNKQCLELKCQFYEKTFTI